MPVHSANFVQIVFQNLGYSQTGNNMCAWDDHN